MSKKLPTIVNAEIERNWVVGVGHVSSADMGFLEAAADGQHPELSYLSVDRHSFGVNVHVGDDAQQVLESADCAEQGALLSKNFANLLRIASTMKVQFLKLDHDGPQYPELPWED